MHNSDDEEVQVSKSAELLEQVPGQERGNCVLHGRRILYYFMLYIIIIFII